MASPSLDQLFSSAVGLHKSGQLLQAEELCRLILTQQPEHAEAIHLLAIIAAKLGRIESAVKLFRQAVEAKPNWAEAQYDFGNALQHTGRLDEAIEQYRRAVAIKPGLAEAYNNQGVALKESGRPDEAVTAFQHAIALKPDDFKAHNNLGNALRDQGLFEESLAAFARAIALKPTSAEAHNNRGVALREVGRLEDSRDASQHAISLQADFAEAINNLGVLHEDMGQADEALALFRQAISLKPKYAEAHFNMGNAFKAKGQLDESIAAYRRAITLKPRLVEADNNLVYTLHFHPGYDARAIGEEHRRWNRVHAEPLNKLIQPHRNDRDPERKLRIGMISPDLREHPVGRFLLPLLAHHDKNKFEIYAYAQVVAADELTAQLRSHTAQWQSINGLSDNQVAELIRHDKIDILLDLTMHMARNRLLVFARKPAPVQVTWLAYCSTTGLDTIEYRLSDPYLDPRGADDSVYSEQTIRLPETYWCYQPHTTAEVNTLPSLTNAKITFGCLNNFAKVNEAVLIAWAKILQAVPNSQLVLRTSQGTHRQQVLDRMQREYVDADRIVFVDRVPMAEYFNQYHSIDIALDTFPYGGGTITCDALWMGVPVVSLIGQTAVGRGGLSILSNIGLADLATRTELEYVHLATQLAKNLPRLTQLRSTLRQRMEKSPLMNAPRFATHIEAAYRQMWRRWCATS